MAYYIVKAIADQHKLSDLRERLDSGEIEGMRPFGQALDFSLREARLAPDGYAIWEEEDYCSPPLAMERAALLDHYFSDLSVERVEKDQGWARLADLPVLWTTVTDYL